MYKIEDLAKDVSDKERTIIRQQTAKPIWRSFKLWLQAAQKTAPPKSPLGIAIGYALNHYQYLTHYLSDGRIDICNNWGENQFRPLSLVERTGVCKHQTKGAKASAVLYSLAITCKARGINQFEYFVKALGAAPHCKSKQDWEQLVPG